MPNIELNQTTQTSDFATVPVPLDARRSLWDISLVMSGGPICVAALYAGASLANGLTLVQCAVAVIVGGFLLSLYGAAVGGIGSRLGLSTGMLLQHTFGAEGGKIVNLVLAVCLVGWYAVQTGFFGQTIHAMYPDAGAVTDIRVAAVWGGLLMLSTAYMGYKGLSILSLIAVPLLVVICGWGLFAATRGAELSAYLPPHQMTIGEGITLIVGALAVGATTTSDVTRFTKSNRHTLIACFVSFWLVNSFMLLGGAMTAVATGSGDLMRAMLSLGLGVPALLILILGQWTTNDDNLYSASLSVVSAVPRLHKHTVVFVLGVSATLLAAAGVADRFVEFLLILGVAITPIGGILVADHLVLAPRSNSGPSSKISHSAFVAWICGTLTGAKVGWGVPAINSVLVAFVVFVVLEKSRLQAKQAS